MVYIGIDPGKKGGYAAIKDGVAETHLWDNEAFIEWLKQIDDQCIVCLEHVHAFPGDTGKSSFNFGKSAGFIEGVLSALGKPYQLVDPRRWKNSFALDSDKAKSIEVCKHLFPGVSLLPNERCKVSSDGMAEALLMAEYARRNL